VFFKIGKSQVRKVRNHSVLIASHFSEFSANVSRLSSPEGFDFLLAGDFPSVFISVAFETWNKFAFDFYWHIRIFIDRFNLHFDFNFAVVVAVVLANKAKAFCIYLRRLVSVVVQCTRVLYSCIFFVLDFFLHLFLPRHKLVAAVGSATSRWVQQKHTFAIFIKFYCINYLIYDFLFALRLLHFAFCIQFQFYGAFGPLRSINAFRIIAYYWLPLPPDNFHKQTQSPVCWHSD